MSARRRSPDAPADPRRDDDRPADGRAGPDAGDEGSGEGRTFADHMDALGSVEPMPEGPRTAAPAEDARIPSRAGARTEPDPLRPPDPEDPLLACRSFVRRRVLRDLRAGRIRPARTVDLHRLDRRAAARRVHEEIAEARRARERCVLVVAGRGRHSERGAPLLREALPGWLADPRLEGAVAAFAPAIPADGGRGAVYVLLA